MNGPTAWAGRSRNRSKACGSQAASIVPGRNSYDRASASYAEAKMAADGYQTNSADATSGQENRLSNNFENVKKTNHLDEVLFQESEEELWPPFKV